MADIRIIDLPTEENPSPTNDYVSVDGTSTRKVLLGRLFSVFRPFASKAEAEAGNATDKTMTPQRVSQHWAARVLDEDDLASDADDKVPTQQSVKAYIDSNPPPEGSVGTREVSPEFAHSLSPFGRSGVRVLVGEENDAHYFGAGWQHFETSNKTLYVCRRGSNHGTRNGGEIVAYDSYDKGLTLENERVLYSNPAHDARPGSLTRMASGRVGMLVGRPAEAGSPLDPLFMYSDDEGVTWNTVTVVRPGGSTAYAFVTGQPLVNIPADHPAVTDVVPGPQAFVAYGSMNAGVSLDAAFTNDNGATWGWKFDVTDVMPPEILRYSEHDCMQLGGGRYLFYFRNKDAADEWRNEAIVCKVTNLFAWPTPFIDTGVLISASPPCTFVDHDTNMAYFLATSRKGFVNYGLENWAVLFQADIDDLWAADGDFGALGAQVQPVMPMPDWYTSYPFAGKIGETWWFMCTAGEINNADNSLLCWVGDFIASGAERERWNYYLRTRVPATLRIEVTADTNNTDDYVFKAFNRSGTAGAGFGAYRFTNKLATATLNYIFEVGGSLITRLGDALGVKKLIVQNSAEAEVASIDSNGKATVKGLVVNGFSGFGSPGTALTIASGAITATRSYHLVDTEGAAATDDLDVINGGSIGDILILGTPSSTRDVTVKNSANINCGSDRVLASASQRIVLMKVTSTAWYMLAFN